MELTQGAAESADLCDLWVTPEARNTGVASRLVQSAADQAEDVDRLTADDPNLMDWLEVGKWSEDGRRSTPSVEGNPRC